MNTAESHELDRRLIAAIGIAEEAGAMALNLRAKGLAPAANKGWHDFVTEADLAIEKMIRERITHLFPNDNVLGEEGGGGFADSLWVVDPIDGTANYAHGGDDWCISIAHVDRGYADIGVIYAPSLSRMHSARLGGGAKCNGETLSIPAEVPTERSVIEIDWGIELGRPALRTLIETTLEAGLDFRRSGSCALGLANVAAGRIDGYIEPFTRPWDALAGCVLVREARGTTSNFEIGLFEAMGNPITASVPSLFPTLLAITAAADKARTNSQNSRMYNGL